MHAARTAARLAGLALLAMAFAAAADEPAEVALPEPRMAGGMPLLQALKARQSIRAFSPKPLPEQMLADLLWAAFGINRPESGKRTAPSARNWQEVEIYAVMASGAFRYDAAGHRLVAVVSNDLRQLTGPQAFVAGAPLNLVYVADMARMQGADPPDQALYAGADVGFIAQNVYLFCASEGLATVVRGILDRDALARVLNLSDRKRIIFAQTVGYPADDR